MRKDLRFRLRSFEFSRCGKVDKKNRRSRRSALVRHLQITPQDVPHRRRRENGQRLLNADIREFMAAKSFTRSDFLDRQLCVPRYDFGSLVVVFVGGILYGSQSGQTQ